MAEINIFTQILRTKLGVWGFNMSNSFYSLKTPKISIVITNPPKQDSNTNKSRYAKIYLDTTEIITIIRKLRIGAKAITNNQGKLELYKAYKGGVDKKKRFGVDIVSRIFTLYVDKGKIYAKIEISKGNQIKAQTKEGNYVPGVVKPAGGPILESVTFGFSDENALNLAFILEKEYEAWRAALNYDLLSNPKKYEYHSAKNNEENFYFSNDQPIF